MIKAVSAVLRWPFRIDYCRLGAPYPGFSLNYDDWDDHPSPRPNHPRDSWGLGVLAPVFKQQKKCFGAAWEIILVAILSCPGRAKWRNKMIIS